ARVRRRRRHPAGRGRIPGHPQARPRQRGGQHRDGAAGVRGRPDRPGEDHARHGPAGPSRLPGGPVRARVGPAQRPAPAGRGDQGPACLPRRGPVRVAPHRGRDPARAGRQPEVTGIGCVSVGGCKAPLDLLDRLAYSGAELAERIPRLRVATGASGLAILSTCQRVELYAAWAGEPDLPALTAALAADRGVPEPVVSAAATAHAGDAAARHLLRVATGLESFVLGEAEVAGQVRAAAEASRSAGGDVALDRLLDTAVSAARRAHRRTGVAATSRSVAAAALDVLAADLPGRRLLLVGAG